MIYEYNVSLIENKSWFSEREKLLNRWGAMGWDLVSVVVEGGVTYFYFKRIREE